MTVSAGGRGSPPLHGDLDRTAKSPNKHSGVECGAGAPEAESVATRKSNTSDYRRRRHARDASTTRTHLETTSFLCAGGHGSPPLHRDFSEQKQRTVL
jgi:hypothetical protein